MPHMPNYQEFGDVGQGKATTEVVKKYDSTYGTYKEQAPAVSSTPKPVDQPKPFSLGGEQ